MDSRVCDVAVIGGGPAGLQAARAASDSGARTLVVEREERLGGILKQCIHDGFGILEYGERLTGPEYACRDIAAARDRGIPCVTNAFVHELEGLADGYRITVITPQGGVEVVTCSSVVMATGCRERTDRQAFLQGDRPAGIFTAGQAQRLINIHGVLPGRRVVILGSGDIGLIMARRFTLEGAVVLGVYEVKAEPSGLARNVAQCLEDWSIPLHLRCTVTEVHGRDRVQAVTVCPIGEDGKPDIRREHTVVCDALVLGVGLIPENDIIAGLGVGLDERTRGPCVTQDRQTERPGLFVCGNALHVYDLVDYVSECGRIAGRGAALRALEKGAAGYAARGHNAPAARIAVSSGGEVAYQVPQYLDTSTPEPPVLFYRVSRAMDRATLALTSGDTHLMSRRLRYLRPQEMERIQLEEPTWERVRGCADGIALTVEESRHG